MGCHADPAQGPHTGTSARRGRSLLGGHPGLTDRRQLHLKTIDGTCDLDMGT